MTHKTLIGFSTQPTNVFSRMIRWFSGSRASHAWLCYFDLDWMRYMVLEATEGGFRVIPYSKFTVRNAVVALVDPRFNLTPGERAAVEWLGDHYDYTGLVGMLWVQLGRWLSRKWQNPFASSRAMFCSEAVVRVLHAASYPESHLLDAASTSPRDLLRFLEERGCPRLRLPARTGEALERV